MVGFLEELTLQIVINEDSGSSDRHDVGSVVPSSSLGLGFAIPSHSLRGKRVDFGGDTNTKRRRLNISRTLY